MIVPTVRKVAPRCYQCGAPDGPWTDGRSQPRRLLIVGDGPVLCRSCIQVGVRLAVVGLKP